MTEYITRVFYDLEDDVHFVFEQPAEQGPPDSLLGL